MKATKEVKLDIGLEPSRVYDVEGFRSAFRLSENKEMQAMYEDDIILECVDLKKAIESTSLKYEIDKLERAKVKLTNENDKMAKRERNVIKFQQNTSSGLVDINAYNRDPENPNCYMRPIRKKAPKFAKHFYLDIALSYKYNQDVEMVINKFKRAMPPLERGLYDISCFVRAITMTKKKKNVVVVFPQLNFNNAFFPREIKYVLLGSGGLSHVAMWCTNLFGGNKIENGYVSSDYRENVVRLQVQ